MGSYTAFSVLDSADIAAGGAVFAAVGLCVALIAIRGRALRQRNAARARETELGEAIGALRHSERQLRALLRNSSDVIVVAAADATVMYCAGSAGVLLGENHQRLAGVRLTEFVSAQDTGALLALCQTTETASAELALRFADGSVHDCELRARGLVDDSAWWGSVLNIRDITERRKFERERARNAELEQRVAAEQEKRELEARLFHAQRLESIGALAGGVAHDFNNLLAVILNYVGFVLEDLPPESESRDDVAQIGRAAERGLRLTEQLLAFRKRKPGKPEVLDPGKVIAEMQALLARPLGSHIALSYDPPTDLWLVHADASDIEQIVLNLVANARDALPDGGQITIRTENTALDEPAAAALDLTPGRYVLISVADNGCGIDPNTLGRVWEALFTTKPPDKGTGLGLATVRTIARHAAGAAAITSVHGEGTQVDVYLPTTDGPPRAEGKPPSPPRAELRAPPTAAPGADTR